MFRLYPGASVDRPPGAKYAATLPFAELRLTGAVPKPATLAKWRATMPEGFECSLVAPKSVLWSEKGPLREGPDLDAGVAWLHEAQAATNAHLVIPTTSALTTSKRDRARLQSFFGRIERPEGRHLIWAPRGLWEAELAFPFADELNVVCAFDPLLDDAPGGSVLYARCAAMGARQRFGEEVLFELLEAVIEAEPQEAFVAIESPRSVSEASNFQRIAAGG